MAKDPDRVYLSTCTAKVMNFLRLGEKEKAKQWAALLVQHLKKMGLLPPDSGVGG